jgi:hypothetical protein
VRPVRGAVAVAALWLTLVAGVAGIVASSLDPIPVKDSVFIDIAYAIAMIAAVVALVRKDGRRPLLYFVLGAWFIAVSLAIFDVLAIPHFHEFSTGGRVAASSLAFAVSHIAGVIAVVLLLIALRGSAERGGWVAFDSPPTLLFCVVVLAALVWRVQELTRFVAPQYSSGNLTYPSDDYPYVVSAVVALLVTVIVAWYALTLKDRSLGGAMLLGWLVTEIFVFLAFITQGWFNRHRTVADNLLEAVLLATSVLLTLVYMRRRQTVP